MDIDELRRLRTIQKATGGEGDQTHVGTLILESFPTGSVARLQIYYADAKMTDIFIEAYCGDLCFRFGPVLPGAMIPLRITSGRKQIKCTVHHDFVKVLERAGNAVTAGVEFDREAALSDARVESGAQSSDPSGENPTKRVNGENIRLRRKKPAP